MADNQEQEGRSSSSEKASRNQTGDGGVAPSKGDLMRLKLKAVAKYVLLGLAPAIAIAALVIAMSAVKDSRSGQDQLGEVLAKLEGVNASLSASKIEIEKLKLLAAKEKTQQGEERAKLEERLALIAHNITPLQVKLKIRPTLAEQLNLSASAPAVTSTAAHTAATSLHQPASAPPAPAKPTPSTHTDSKLSPQVKAMKDAIEQYNKK